MKFGVREICNVTFKAAADNQVVGTKVFKKYQPVFTIDTATTSEMTQESTTVYAQGGRGYNRLIAWEGEKTMTFTVTDALMSPMGMAVLSGAGLIKANEDNIVHVHTTVDANVKADNIESPTKGTVEITLSDICEELGIPVLDNTKVLVCGDTNTKVYGTVLDGAGAGIDWINEVTIKNTAVENEEDYSIDKVTPLKLEVGKEYVGKTVKFDFYVLFKDNASQINIEPDSFGGNFYVEADTLFRRQDDGKDMAATLTFPLVKVQSGFTFTMAASGDPSTFDFTMDALPGYTQFDRTKKVCVAMAFVGADKDNAIDNAAHSDHKATP